MNLRINTVLTAVCLLGGAWAQAQQTTPFNLSVVAPMTASANGDAKAQEFQTALLPAVLTATNAEVTSGLTVAGYTVQQIDPAQIAITTGINSRAYLVGETTAKYHNSLGFNTAGIGVTSGNPMLAVQDALAPSATPGDYVDLGRFVAGTNLDFFLISNGGLKPNYYAPQDLDKVFSTNAAANLDGLEHVMAFAIKDSPYLLLSFEDLVGGGDLDYNDAVFVVDIGRANIANFFAAPEPSLLLALGSFTAVMLSATGRRRR